MQRHVQDSLALLPAIEAHASASGDGPLRLVDVGSGAGPAWHPARDCAPSVAGVRVSLHCELLQTSTMRLPCFRKKVAAADAQVTLLDSLRKRCIFVDAAAKEIGPSECFQCMDARRGCRPRPGAARSA